MNLKLLHVQSISRLVTAATAANAREEENLSATDNVISAIGRIALHQDQPQLIPVWLSGLPLTMDEGKDNHNALCGKYYMLRTCAPPRMLS